VHLIWFGSKTMVSLITLYFKAEVSQWWCWYSSFRTHRWYKRIFQPSLSPVRRQSSIEPDKNRGCNRTVLGKRIEIVIYISSSTQSITCHEGFRGNATK